jgi:hypothetical protein
MDIVRAQHAVVRELFNIDHLRLILGTSMGGMNTWSWGIAYGSPLLFGDVNPDQEIRDQLASSLPMERNEQRTSFRNSRSIDAGGTGNSFQCNGRLQTSS